MRLLTEGNQRFANTMHRRSVSGGMVVLLNTAAGETFYFATSAFVYPPYVTLPATFIVMDGIVEEISPVKTSLDIVSMTTEIANCTVTLSALPMERKQATADKWRSVTDSLWKVMGQSAAVYLFPGGPVPASPIELTDLFRYVALCVGYFRVADIKAQDSGRVVIELTEWDVSTLRRTVFLPQRKFTRALFPAIEEDRIGVGMPLLWGGDSSDANLELIGSFHPIQRVSNDTWLICDHDEFICAGKGTAASNLVVWIPQLEALATCIYNSSHIGFLNSGGRGYVHVEDMYELQFRVTIPPTRSFLDYVTPDPNSALAWDNDLDTGASVVASYSNLGMIYFEWCQQGTPEDSAWANPIAEITTEAGTGYCRTAKLWLNMQAAVTTFTSCELQVWTNGAWVTFNANPIAAGSTALVSSAFGFDNGATPPTYDWTATAGAKGPFWHLGSGANGTGADGYPFKCRLVFHNTSNNWTAGQLIAEINEVRLQIDAKGIMQKRTSNWGTVVVVPPGSEGFPSWMRMTMRRPAEITSRDFGDRGIGFRPSADTTTAIGFGRKFGSWITGRISSVTLLTAGKAITQAQYIIESILRDELGYGDLHIDYATFDAIYNTYGWGGRHMVSIPAGARIGAKDLIDRICYEAGLVLVYASPGKWRIIKYDAAAMSASPQFTVYPDDLIDMSPILIQTPVEQIRNDIVVNFSQFVPRGNYQRKRTYTDAASVTRFGSVQDSFDLSTISGDTGAVGSFGTRLVGTNGILSRPHGGARLRTIGWKFAHVEIGDKGQLDPSFDYHRMYFGRSWGGKVFLVTDVAIGLDQVDIEVYDALELYAP